MISSVRLSEADFSYRAKLDEFLANDLYRRAMPSLLSVIPGLALYCLILRDSTQLGRPLLWAFVALILVIVVRSAILAYMRRTKASRTTVHRVRIFAATSGLVGLGMATVICTAMPLASSEQFGIVSVIVISIMALGVLSMGPSVSSYLAYMAPNMIALIYTVPFTFSSHNAPVMQLVLALTMAELVLMITYRNKALCRVALLGIKHQETNDALSQRNNTLECLNHALADTQSQLLQSEKMASVGQLAAGVAHEINNPVGWVRSNLGTLRDYTHRLMAILQTYEEMESSLPHDCADVLKAVRAAKAAADLNFLRIDAPQLIEESLDGISRIDKIVQDLKSFSRIDDNDWQITDLHVGLETSLSMATHELKYKARIIKEYGPAPDIECLPFQLNQVFLNLLVNAAQAIEDEGTVTIRTGGDAHNAWVQISDTGQGISRESQHRIFDPFYTTKPVGVGTGLGLSVSYGIVKKHGGSIEVDSEVGTGTTFTVRLPARQDHLVAAEPAEPDTK